MKADAARMHLLPWFFLVRPPDTKCTSEIPAVICCKPLFAPLLPELIRPLQQLCVQEKSLHPAGKALLYCSQKIHNENLPAGVIAVTQRQTLVVTLDIGTVLRRNLCIGDDSCPARLLRGEPAARYLRRHINNGVQP